jgi:hypothetical protein
MEIVEIPEHRYYVAAQFHPEFKSRVRARPYKAVFFFFIVDRSWNNLFGASDRRLLQLQGKGEEKEKEATMSLEAALDDVEARFLYNLPADELAKADRLFFQIEQAHWFYEGKLIHRIYIIKS